MTTATLIGNRYSREDVFALTPPAHTQSWKPVSYGDAVEFLHEEIRRTLKMDVVREEYALNQTGLQMFHVAQLDTGTGESGMAIGLRQSYDKSMALGVVSGAQVFVCSNLCFNGDSFKVMRKNTTNVWDDFKTLIRAQISTAGDAFSSMQVDMGALKAVPCGKRWGYAMLGVMRGERLLTSTQANVAYGDWDEPRHDDFGDRNLWGLYNAVTEGLKKGTPQTAITRHTRAHEYFMRVAQTN
jgi:hypothetical protein